MAWKLIIKRDQKCVYILIYQLIMILIQYNVEHMKNLTGGFKRKYIFNKRAAVKIVTKLSSNRIIMKIKKYW